MRLSIKTAIMAVVIGAFGLLTVACDADPIDATVPGNIAEIKATPMGAALAQYGYIPAATLFTGDDVTKVVGYAYVNCGNQPDLSVSECARDLHNRATLEHPNIYANTAGEIIYLEGVHVSDNDSRSYYSTVPERFRDFAKLSEGDRRLVFATVNRASNSWPRIDTSIGAQSAYIEGIGQVAVWTD